MVIVASVAPRGTHGAHHRLSEWIGAAAAYLALGVDACAARDRDGSRGLDRDGADWWSVIVLRWQCLCSSDRRRRTVGGDLVGVRLREMTAGQSFPWPSHGISLVVLLGHADLSV